MAELRAEQPMGRFNWLGTYTNASHLAFAEVAEIWRDAPGIGAALKAMMNLPFYKALFFTVIYTAIVTPLVIVLGFLIALAVNGVPRILKGPVIFFSLLPMIVTPLIGSARALLDDRQPRRDRRDPAAPLRRPASCRSRRRRR